MTQQWKPIESAPKDCSEFLACYTRQGNVTQIVKWNTLHGYFSSKGEPLPGFTTNATHWMPLPAAPGTPPASAQDDAKDERQAFEAWLYLDQTQHDPDDLNKSEIELAREAFSAGLRRAAPAPAAGDARLLEFVREVAQQKPEKPDYWSSCGQCASNIIQASDLLDGIAASQQQEG